MIVVVKKNNIALIALILLLAITIYSLNLGTDEAAQAANPQVPQKTVIVDAGHGGEDPGKESQYSGLLEKNLNLSIAIKVKALLEKDNYKVILTRSEDILEYPPEAKGPTAKRKADLTRRKKIMDESGADIVVSIHMNSIPQTQYSGAQTFYPHNSPESQKLAQILQKSMRETVDPNNKREALVRGKPDELPIMIFRNLKVPTAVVECGFLSNPDEEKLLGTEEYQGKIALAIKNGVDSYFGKTIKK